MDGVFDVEKPLFPPNWKVDLLLSPDVSLLSNMPAHHYDTSPEKNQNKHKCNDM
jgi:hypothetical protein